MKEELKTVLEEAHSDIGEDFIASEIIGQDGISIASETGDIEYNSQLAGAHYAMIMKLATRVSDNLKLGKVIENQVSTNQLISVARPLGDGSFYWLLIAKAESNIGLLRAVMDQHELRLFGAIPS
jgi:predicted regulator of Ras-like GTPase activity (Roadblock/LC7/MglB family)